MTNDRVTVAAWLDAYRHAWDTYDPTDIEALFAEDCVYHAEPYREPLRGRDAVLAAWLEEPDPKGTYDGRYEPFLVCDDWAVATGQSRYFKDGKLDHVYDNVFVLRFAPDGRCREYREWYMREPKDDGP